MESYSLDIYIYYVLLDTILFNKHVLESAKTINNLQEIINDCNIYTLFIRNQPISCFLYR